MSHCFGGLAAQAGCFADQAIWSDAVANAASSNLTRAGKRLQNYAGPAQQRQRINITIAPKTRPPMQRVATIAAMTCLQNPNHLPSLNALTSLNYAHHRLISSTQTRRVTMVYRNHRLSGHHAAKSHHPLIASHYRATSRQSQIHAAMTCQPTLGWGRKTL